MYRIIILLAVFEGLGLLTGYVIEGEFGQFDPKDVTNRFGQINLSWFIVGNLFCFGFMVFKSRPLGIRETLF